MVSLSYVSNKYKYLHLSVKTDQLQFEPLRKYHEKYQSDFDEDL